MNRDWSQARGGGAGARKGRFLAGVTRRKLSARPDSRSVSLVTCAASIPQQLFYVKQANYVTDRRLPAFVTKISFNARLNRAGSA